MKKTKTIKQTNKIANQVPVAGTESGNLGKRVRPSPSHNSLPIGWHLSRNFFSERDFFCFLLDLGFYICGLTLAFQWWVESKPVQCWQLSPEIREQGKEKRSVYWAYIKSAVPLFMRKKKEKSLGLSSEDHLVQHNKQYHKKVLLSSFKISPTE